MMQDLLSFDENLGPRNAAPVPQGEIHEDQTKGMRHPVAWFTDTPTKDIRMALIFACDSIFKGPFELIELTPRLDSLHLIKDYINSTCLTINDEQRKWFSTGVALTMDEIHKVKNDWCYELRAGTYRSDMQKLVGDKWRALKVEVDPTFHFEAQQAFKRMQSGANLLKHTSGGLPHLRQFQLSADRKRLLWYTANKNKQDAMVWVHDIQEVLIGQQSSTFKKYPLPLLQHLSFSIVVEGSDKTIDLTCKDEPEFDIWVTGLKALVLSEQGMTTSKAALLAHSRKFRRAVEKEDSSIVFSKLPDIVVPRNSKGKVPKGYATLDDVIDVPAMPIAKIVSRAAELTLRQKGVKQRAHLIDRSEHIFTQQPSRLPGQIAVNEDGDLTILQLDMSVMNPQRAAFALHDTEGPSPFSDASPSTGLSAAQAAYVAGKSAYGQAEQQADEAMELQRLDELLDSAERMLQQVQLALIRKHQADELGPGNEDLIGLGFEGDKGKTVSEREAEQLLWKVEVDLENAEDILGRYQSEKEKGLNYHLNEFTASVERGFDDTAKKISVGIAGAWGLLSKGLDDFFGGEETSNASPPPREPPRTSSASMQRPRPPPPPPRPNLPSPGAGARGSATPGASSPSPFSNEVSGIETFAAPPNSRPFALASPTGGFRLPQDSNRLSSPNFASPKQDLIVDMAAAFNKGYQSPERRPPPHAIPLPKPPMSGYSQPSQVQKPPLAGGGSVDLLDL